MASGAPLLRLVRHVGDQSLGSNFATFLQRHRLQNFDSHGKFSGARVGLDDLRFDQRAQRNG